MPRFLISALRIQKQGIDKNYLVCLRCLDAKHLFRQKRLAAGILTSSTMSNYSDAIVRDLHSTSLITPFLEKTAPFNALNLKDQVSDYMPIGNAIAIEKWEVSVERYAGAALPKKMSFAARMVLQ